MSLYLPCESTWSRGNVGGPEVDDWTWLIKARLEWGEPGEGGWRGCRRRNRGTGLSGGASMTLGAAHQATPTHCSASCTDSDLFIHTKFKHFTDKYKKNGRQRKDHTIISVSCHPTIG